MAIQRELVEQIFEAAVTLGPSERTAFLDKKCRGDTGLRRMVESLLAEDDRAGSFLEHPPFEFLSNPKDPSRIRETTLAGSRALSQMPAGRLKPGTVLKARFEILRYLNRGGMGEVYEAWDSDLREIVALKTIRPELMSDSSAVRYFKEEVKQARQIAHPNVCRVYDLYSPGESSFDQTWFLTMELLEGRTLADHLDEEGPFSKEEALPLIEQLVSGLSAAHELGVVHRDFKSANIMLTSGPGGKVRAVITDFGLARRMMRAGPRSSKLRGQGTPAYVAPEQWRDGIVGPEADQYALGAVICEMITGERLTPANLEGFEPQAARLPVGIKVGDRWQKVIQRCVEVEPEDRFGSVNEILPALEPGRRRKTVLSWLIPSACFLLVTAGAVFLTVLMNRGAEIQHLRQLTPAINLSTNPSLARDGKTIAYASDRAETGNLDIWVQQLPDGQPRRITTDPAADDEPSLSPDGRFVAFRSDRGQGGIYIADIAGEGDRLLAAGGHGPRFSPDGRSIVYWTGDDNMVVASARLYLLNVAGGKPVQLAPDFADAREPIWSSDGRHILFKGCRSGSRSILTGWDWWVTSISGGTPRATGAVQLLNRLHLKQMGEFGGWYGDTVLFSAAQGREVHLWRLNISSRDFAARGEPRELAPNDLRESIISSSLAGDVLAFTDLSTAFHIWRIDHGSDPGRARAYKVTQDAELDNVPYISQNGRWLTYARGFGEDRKVWIKQISSGKETPFFPTGKDELTSIVNDDGSMLAYEAWENGIPSIFLARSGSQPSRLCTNCRAPTGWLDGNAGLLYTDDSMSRVSLYSLSDNQSRVLLSKPGANIAEATWSPANEHLLFTLSADHVNGQVFAARFPRGRQMPDTEWIPITDPSEASEKPRWSGDGKTVFYLSNRDSHWCVWGRHFDPVSHRAVGSPFAVQHYHDLEFSPYPISSHLFNLSVAGDSVYFNVAQISGTIWTGQLRTKDSLFQPH